MPSVRLLGEVVPNVFEISFTDLPDLDWHYPEIDLTMSFRTKINKSRVEIICKMNRFTDADFVHVWMRAYDIARGYVNLACFSTGTGATLVMNKYNVDDGELRTILAQDKNLAPLCTVFTLGATPNLTLTSIVAIVMQQPALFMALDDLIASITLPHHAAINCGRVLDGLRKLIAPTLSAKQSWEVFRNHLQFTEDYLKLITDSSTAPRHGDRSHISGAVITEIARRSWIIMNRFLEYRKRGNQPLPIVEFPLL